MNGVASDEAWASPQSNRLVASYWVLADRGGRGKTTVASALVRVLNGLGCPTIGFKPLGGINLRKDHAVMTRHFRPDGETLFGGDAVCLAESSPLTDASMVEVVGPSYRLMLDGRVLLVRKGSSLLGDRQFLKPALEVEKTLLDPELIELLERRYGLEFSSANLVSTADPLKINQMASHSIDSALQFLRARGAEAIVMEGARDALPWWRGNRLPDHLFVVSEHEIFFWSHLVWSDDTLTALAVPRGGLMPSTPSLRRLAPRLPGNAVKTKLRKVQGSAVSDYAADLVGGFLRHAGLPSR